MVREEPSNPSHPKLAINLPTVPIPANLALIESAYDVVVGHRHLRFNNVQILQRPSNLGT